MNEDKRTVHTDALETLGSIIDEREKRDAIHLAVCPVMAQEELVPGQHVGSDGTTKNPVGIVDPFLETSVKPGQRFWLVIYPRKINSLRHVWSHHAFPDEIEGVNIKDRIKESKEWIMYHLETSERVTLDDILEAAEDFVKTGDISILYGDRDYKDEFWYHYEVVTGKKIPDSKKGNFFRCYC